MLLASRMSEFQDILVKTPHISNFASPEHLAFMCHEIGTPLSAIIGLSDILASEGHSLEKRRQCAEMLKDSSAMLIGLMKNMLEASRLEEGMVEIENIRFNVLNTIKQAVSLMSIRAEEKGLGLYLAFANKTPSHGVGDPLRIRQILINLIGNAIKFTDSGSISLLVDTKNDRLGNIQLHITVTDTGVGIEEQTTKKIFDKFTQANSSISREYGGSGLGLFISQDLARLMGGYIDVKSSLGVGSCFTLVLPLSIKPSFQEQLLVAA